MARWVVSARWVVFALAALAWLGAPPVAAGILVRADLEGVALEIESSAATPIVALTVDARRYLIDTEKDQIFAIEGDVARLVEAGRIEDGRATPYKLTRWWRGPKHGGHASEYHVLTLDEITCGETLVSAWMKDFVDPLVRAVELAQSVEPSLRPPGGGHCGAIPFRVWAKHGWPLMAGRVDEVAFDTLEIRFDHKPPPGALDVVLAKN